MKVGYTRMDIVDLALKAQDEGQFENGVDVHLFKIGERICYPVGLPYDDCAPEDGYENISGIGSHWYCESHHGDARGFRWQGTPPNRRLHSIATNRLHELTPAWWIYPALGCRCKRCARRIR